MKVWWTEESVRLRITLPELELLQQNKPVEMELTFPGGNCWTVAIKPWAGDTRLISEGCEVSLYLSLKDVERLGRREAEGLYFQHDFQDQRQHQPALRYFIEKDFAGAEQTAHDAGDVVIRTITPAKRVHKGYRMMTR